MFRCAEDQDWDETYRVVSCLRVMVGDILRVSISRVLTRGRCDIPLAWRLASHIILQTARFSKKSYRIENVGFEFLYKFYLKYFSF